MSNRIIHTADPKMREILKVVEAVATSRASILIYGQSGTGKELLARYAHAKSARSSEKFFAVNCAALPDGLLESELFGYEKGSFTGADNRKIGLFEQACDGTFLLDEISELPLLLQAKLLRVLQENEVQRLGSSKPIPINVRVIATSNKPLDELVARGSFREDLYYRLNVIPITVPPLVERPKDIDLLARLFVDLAVDRNGLTQRKLSLYALNKIRSWTWPGNIRELQNTMERSALLSQGEEITADEIQIAGLSIKPEDLQLKAGMTVSQAEKILIVQTLEYTNQNRTRAAELLGISIRTLRNKINEYKQGAQR